MKLPASIQSYFDADRSNNGKTLVLAFAPDAIVEDEGKSHAGREAIHAWWRETKARYQTVVEPFGATEGDAVVNVRAKVTGQFPSSPATLTFEFRLKDNQISNLAIHA